MNFIFSVNFSSLYLCTNPPETAATTALPQALLQSACPPQNEPVTRKALTTSLAFGYGVSQK